MPRFHVENDLRTGHLVEILAATPLRSIPVSLVFSNGRQLSPRVRAFIDWAISVFKRAEQTGADASLFSVSYPRWQHDLRKSRYRSPEKLQQPLVPGDVMGE